MKKVCKSILLLGLVSSLFATSFKVGALLPLSGRMGDLGKRTLDGMRWIYQYYNRFKTGDNIKILTVDNQSDKIATKNAYSKLVYENKVVAVEGPLISENAVVIKRIADATFTPTVTPFATDKRATAGSKVASRVSFVDVFEAEAAARYAIKNKVKKVAIFADMKQGYSVRLTSIFRNTLHKIKKYGVLTKVLFISTGQKNFSSQISALAQFKPDFIYLPLYAPEAAMIVRGIRKAGIDATILGSSGIGDAFYFSKLAGIAANGVLYTSPFDYSRPPTPLSKRFIREFKAKYHRLPGPYEATGVDAYLLIYYALAKCDNSQNKASLQKLRKCVAWNIRHARHIEGVTGYITINPRTGNPVSKSVYIEEIANGKPVFVDMFKPNR